MGFLTIISVGGIILIGISLSVVRVQGFSQSEKTALATFRGRVERTLPQEFMKSNAFLIRFLRLNNLNVGDAEAELKTYLERREREGVDNITAEDVRGMGKVMPFRHEGVDKHGRPIIEFIYGKADIRRIALAGKSDLARKQYIFNFEKALRKTIEIAETTGKDIDSFYVISDLEGTNPRDHLCASCLQISLSLIRVYSAILGPFAKITRAVNAPRIFSPIAAGMKRILTARIIESVFVYDADKEKWKKVLAGDIDPEQLPPRLGGSNTKFDHKGTTSTNT